ncbi:MAG: ABC transporter ATP-binding protein, partial [Gammaproteobacteria bacterium]|nr:ABC transporter ATP-binding protein [Gammaproteobacteria bacterium]
GNALTEVDNPAKNRPAAKRTEPVEGYERVANKKLTFKLKHELEQLPDRIEELERQLAMLHEQTSSSGFYQQPFEKTQPIMERLGACQSELDRAVERWSELESMQQMRDV